MNNIKKTNLSLKYKEMIDKGFDKDKQNKKIDNLFNTEAGQMAIEMDIADGNRDGKISANLWNNYAKGHEGRTTISENGSINVFDAMDSITTYMIKEEVKENGPNVKPAEKDDPNIDYD